MSTLDSSMVNIALPSVMREFHSTLHSTEWVVMMYLLIISVSLLFWGHLGDRFGRRHIYSSGMLIFGIGSFLCGLAPHIYWLIFSRFTQAVGAAMMMASGPALIKECFPTARLGRNLGFIGVAVSLGLLTGPSLGGFLIEFYSWRSIFFVTVPISITFFLLSKIVLPARIEKSNLEKFDWIGIITWGVSITIAMLIITHSPAGWTSPLFYFSTAIGILIFSYFLRHESMTVNPLFPLDLFRERFFYIAIICALLSFAVLFTVTLMIPFFLDNILRLSPSRIGMIMMAIPLAVLIVAPLSGWLSDHIGSRYLTTAGLLLSTISLFLLAQINIETRPLQIAWRLTLLGCGQAMFLAPNSASVLTNVKNHYAGVSAGLLATARNFGMLLGVAQAGVLFAFFFDKHTGGLDLKDFTADQAQSFIIALEATFYTAAAISSTGVILSWLRGGRLKKTRRTLERN